MPYTIIEQLMGVPEAEQRAENAKVDAGAMRSKYNRWAYNFYNRGKGFRLPDNPLTTSHIYTRQEFAPGYDAANTPALQQWIKTPIKQPQVHQTSESFDKLPTDMNKKTASMNYTDFVKQAGFGSRLYAHASDFFNENPVGPFNLFSFGTNNSFVAPMKNWTNLYKPSQWTKTYNYASTPGTASYEARQAEAAEAQNQAQPGVGMGQAMSSAYDWLKRKSDTVRDAGLINFNPADPMGIGNIKNLYNTAKSVITGNGIPTPGQPAQYDPNMSTQQKWDTFQEDARNAVNDNIGFFGGLKAVSDDIRDSGLINFNPADPMGIGNIKNLYNTAKSVITGNGIQAKNTKERVNKALVSPEMQQAADRFLEATNIDDVEYMQRNFDQMIDSVGGIDSPQGQQLANYITTGMQSKVWDAVKEDPIKNLPTAISMWLRSRGMDGIADFVKNPVVFYGGILAALAGGASLLGGFGGGDDNKQPIIINNGGNTDPRMNKVPYA